MEEEQAPPATPGRQMKTVDAGIIVNGVLHLMQSVLSATLHPSAVEKAMASALKEEPCKAMLAAVKGKGKRKGPGLLRSTYTVFVTIFTHAVKGGEDAAKGKGVMAEAGLVWKGLPAPLKAQLVERFEAVRQLYNAKVTAGDAEPSVAAELAAYEAAHGLEPFDFPAMLAYKAVGEAATPAPKKGAPAATPGTAAGKRAASGDQGSSDDEDDADQTPAAAAAAAAAGATAEKKHKKHKKDKEDKKEKKDKKKKKKDKAAAE